MEWNELVITVNNEAVDASINILMENGAGGVQIDDSKGLDNVDIITYFPDNFPLMELIPELEVKIKNLEKFGLTVGQGKVKVTNMGNDTWVDVWKKYYHPVRITRYLTIVPSWEEYTPRQKDEKIIRLDPGRAFGTGTHPTTLLALQALESYIRGDESLIDVGTGSGVLSIAAKYFGAGDIYAYDIDDDAVSAAKENLDLNPISKDVHIAANDLLNGIDKKVDVIVANILAEVIELLIPQAKQTLKDGGLFITSGIIVDKKDKILEQLQTAGFIIDEILNKKDWFSIVAHKPNVGEE
ncbi:50S ribosomal protein L11 methyltransferase [Ligilactobacillus hayakitensis]|nr:50S ribosomal protein L11 methyltransferase [Ligilactobacillus hayakitensis]